VHETHKSTCRWCCTLQVPYIASLNGQTPPFMAVLEVHQCPLLDGSTQIFFSFLFSPCQNKKVSCHLFIISNLILIFFISICFVLLPSFDWIDFQFVPLLFGFILLLYQIWSSFFWFFYPFSIWILFSISSNIWFQFIFMLNFVPILFIVICFVLF
jgi:hypothetical protein